MPNKFRLKHARRKRTIAALMVGGLLLVGVVASSFYLTLQQERRLTVFGPAGSADEQADNPETETTDREMANLFEPAAELSLDEKNRKDEQRRSDISDIHDALQRYFSENGRYPKLTELNSEQFRDIHFPDMPKETFQDPADTGVRVVITRTPQRATYAYDVVNEDGFTCEPSGRQCVSYKLSALLSGGLAFSIESDE